ncbi:MAG: LamG domain-containing protein [Aeoliella sp.]
MKSVYGNRLFRFLLCAVAVSFMLAPASAQDITSNLVAHWALDETSGTTASDSSGNGNSGTFSGSPAWNTGGQIVGCLDFEISDGNDRVNAGTFDLTGSGVTLATWIWQESGNNDARVIIKSTGNSGAQQSWGLTSDETGELDFRIRTGGNWYRVQVPGAISNGVWTHIAGTYDGTTLRVYINGVEAASGAHPVGGAVETDATGTVTLGDSIAGGRPFDGKIDDARVYDRALTATDIAFLFNPTGLAGHWKVDETSGTTAVDSSPIANDGTTNNSILTTQGRRDGAFQFDGSSDYVLVNHDSSYLANDGTVAFWFKTNDVSVTQGLFSKDSSGFDTGGHLTIRLVSSQIEVRQQSTSASYTLQSSTLLSGVWYHVTYQWGAAGMRLLIDGVEVAFDASYTGGLGTTSGGTGNFEPIVFGANSWTSGNLTHTPLQDYFSGAIDDVRFYSQALSDAEIAEVYGFVGHWAFDEGSGTTIADLSLSANDASFNTGTPNWTSGVRGGALEFNGANDAITGASFDPPSEGTVVFWWRSDGPPVSRQRAWGVGGDFEMWQDPDGLVSCDVGTDGFVGGFITTNPLYAPGRWYHIAAVFDSDDDSYEIYINGQLHKNGTSTTAILEQAAGQLSFGTRTGSTQRFAGALDDFRIYNRKLAAAEVAELYGLIGHWKLDETAGITAADSSGVGNDGTHLGGVTVNAFGPYPGVGDVAADYDGVDDATDLPDMDFDFSDGFATAFWFNPDSVPTTFYGLLGISNGQDVDDIWIGWLPGTGMELYFTDTQDGSEYNWLDDNLEPEVNQWQHFVASVDSSGNATIYRDGVAVASGFVSLPSAATRTNNLIGATVWNDELPGRMYDVRIYNRAISHREVAELYGLVGHWQLDETSGNVAADSSGTDLHGTYVGLPLLAELSNSPTLGTAVAFDGVTQHVDLPDMHFDFSNGTAMSAWIKPSAAPSPWYAMLGLANGSGVDETWFGWSSGFGILCFLFDTTDGSPWRSLYDSDEPALNTWHHCIVSIDDAGNATIYRDGVSVATGFTSLPQSVLRTENFIAKSVQDDEFAGTLDDVRLYHRPISDAEAQQIFDDGSLSGLRIIKWVEAR